MAAMSTYERAIQIYQILIGAAHNRQVLTYELLGDKIGVPPWGLANHLDLLMRDCKRKDLPPITVLVVQKDSGRPGEGFTTFEDLHRDRERVFAHDWYRMKPLAVADLGPDPDHAVLRWRRAAMLRSRFDLELENPHTLDTEHIRRLLGTVTRANGGWPAHFCSEAATEFGRWLASPRTPLRAQAYARLSNWFLTSKELYRNSPLSRAAAELWDVLFCARPVDRLTDPKLDHKILPDEFDRWWTTQQGCQMGR